MSASATDEFATAKGCLELPAFPGENPRLHEAVQWWEIAQTRIASAGLSLVVTGGLPAAAARIVDTPLDTLPDLPATHPHFEKRRELRVQLQAKNTANAKIRDALVMDGRTALSVAFHRAAESTAPMFARELRERCDYARHGFDGGHFDGTLAYRMAHSKLFATERTKADREFYRTAESLQRSSRLSDGCKAEDFTRKAYAFIYRIRPHLAQAYSDLDAAEYIVDLMPKRLASDARRIKDNCVRDGSFTDLMHLTRELAKVVFDDQSATQPAPALVALSPLDASRFDAVHLSEICGMSLSVTGEKQPESYGFAAADGKWCPQCPHGGKMCFADPDFEGPFPPSVHLNADRKKAHLKAKAENAKRAGVPNKRVIHAPSQKEIDDFNPSHWSYTPADETLVREHEAACATRQPASKELTERYGSLFGSLMHAVKYRPEISTALGLLGSCLTFPTEALYECAVRVLVYLGRTRLLGTSFSRHGDTKLHAYADSNWLSTRSTTGYVIFLAGGAIAHASRRQHCISMSSCEAELVALADLAIELIYITRLLEFIGHEHAGPVEVSTDNKGAYDLCHRFTSAQNSRHIERKVFKMRELRGAGVVAVKHVPTEHNPADLFTKVLGRQVFEKHRRTVLNLPCGEGVEKTRRLRGGGS